MADNAVEKLIYDELRGVDELLNIHAYHKQVLTDLLRKMNGQTGAIGRDIRTLPLTDGTINCLMEEGIYTVEALTKKTYFDLFRLPNIGKKRIRDIESALHMEDLSLSNWREDSKEAVLEKIGLVEEDQTLKINEVSDEDEDRTEASTEEPPAKNVDPDVDWLVPLPISSKPEANRINRARRLELSVIVARMVKSQGCKKIDAIKELYRKGDINHHEFMNLPRQISRSHLGSDHDLLFEGTKYANKK